MKTIIHNFVLLIKVLFAFIDSIIKGILSLINHNMATRFVAVSLIAIMLFTPIARFFG